MLACDVAEAAMPVEEFKTLSNFCRVKCCWNCRFIDGSLVCAKSGISAIDGEIDVDTVCDLHEEESK